MIRRRNVTLTPSHLSPNGNQNKYKNKYKNEYKNEIYVWKLKFILVLLNIDI